MNASSNTSIGCTFPLGAVLVDGGANFSVFSKYGTEVQLVFFDHVDDVRPARILELDAHRHRTWNYWHVFVPGIKAGQLYGYRVSGPLVPDKGLRFDFSKLLLDPYARCIAQPAAVSRRAASAPGDNAATAFRSVVTDPGAYDWEGDRNPRTPFKDSIIYELHVGNFTRHPGSGVDSARRGTFAGVIEKIPYLRQLGVTAVELLPVFAFDEEAAPMGRRNVWGYQPIGFFAPHPGYASGGTDPLAVVDEFRDMVKALHRAGIEVILDVVYNHTAEDGADGPTWSFRGLANDTYYILQDGAGYANYSGTGNSLDASDSVVRRMILDSLRYWSSEMHVDGFRFDLAAVLSRDTAGNPIPSPPVFRDIESDPVLTNVKLIAEAWDAAGLYRLGDFADNGWHEWNGHFRDDVRRFLRGDPATVQALASRLAGSPDIYTAQRCDAHSINFVTCHDGFTLTDLVSYNVKHNEANGEANRDGANDNYSWNCGAEGPTDDADISRLRNRQIRNFLTLTLLAAGTPMLLMGDEIGRTQRGNNNAYCLDDESTWFDWSSVTQRADLLRFTRELIALRLQREHCSGVRAWVTNEPLTPCDLTWHGVRLHQPDWGDASHSLAATIRCEGDTALLHLMVNAYWERLEFEVPVPPGGAAWRRCVDTSRLPPEDIGTAANAETITAASLMLEPRSLIVLVTHPLAT